MANRRYMTASRIEKMPRGSWKYCASCTKCECGNSYDESCEKIDDDGKAICKKTGRAVYPAQGAPSCFDPVPDRRLSDREAAYGISKYLSGFYIITAVYDILISAAGTEEEKDRLKFERELLRALQDQCLKAYDNGKFWTEYNTTGPLVADYLNSLDSTNKIEQAQQIRADYFVDIVYVLTPSPVEKCEKYIAMVSKLCSDFNISTNYVSPVQRNQSEATVVGINPVLAFRPLDK